MKEESSLLQLWERLPIIYEAMDLCTKGSSLAVMNVRSQHEKKRSQGFSRHVKYVTLDGFVRRIQPMMLEGHIDFLVERYIHQENDTLKPLSKDVE